MTKVCIIYTGGTIGMVPTESGFTPSVSIESVIEKKLTAELRCGLPDFELICYDDPIDSSNIRPEHWQRIAADIHRHHALYDGFVILHGTDTMAYTGSMLSFMLRNPGKPVILTGSQIPLVEENSDGIRNLTGALKFASSKRLNEVSLFFCNTLFRANRTRKTSASSTNAFDSPNYPPLGQFAGTAELFCERLMTFNKERQHNNLQFDNRCDSSPRVALLPLYPGITGQAIAASLDPVDALIMLTYGSGNGPDLDRAFLEQLKKASLEGKPVINISQCPHARVDQQRYSSGSSLADVGVISGLDTTPEAMFCKLHWLLSRGVSVQEIIRSTSTNIAGEATVE